MSELNPIYQYIPEPILRMGIRHLCKQRIDEQAQLHRDNQHLARVLSGLRASPIALSTDSANNQHYQVPTAFFRFVLGKHLKYSCCWWDDETSSLDEAEERMLALYCERAGLEDGLRVLDLGCGWGSLSLYLTERFPNMQVTALSNSQTQRSYIETHGRSNLTVITADINDFDTEQQFDVVMSVEMFEHVRNYERLLQRIARWLVPQGRCFVHHFCHKTYTYPFSTEEDQSWMARYFFTDGLMPSQKLLENFVDEFRIVDDWPVNGLHYHKTCEAWLNNLKLYKPEIIEVFSETLDPKSAKLQWKYWQIFFLACSELFAYGRGDEWFVQHYLFEKK